MIGGSAESLVKGLIPPLERCSALLVGSGDVVIHAPGFEDRTMAVAESVTTAGGARAILLDYLPFKKQNRLHDVREALLALRIEVGDDDILKYNRFDPDDFETRLRERLVRLGAHRALVEVSSMSKLAIMLVLNVCKELGLGVVVLYAEAKAYGPSEAEFQSAKQNNEIHRPSLQVYTGVHGVVRVDSLASVAMQGQPTAAIVFMSFNDALTQVLLNTVYPSRLFLVNGRPPLHTWREAATAWIHDQVRREWEEDNPVSPQFGGDLPARHVSTLEYGETVATVLELYWGLSDRYRILLAPAGSKMQAVGCYLAKALHPDIHIEYPSPEGFKKRYSSGIGPRWMIDFGGFAGRVKAIADAERRNWLEIPTSAAPS
jgi:hypothetical protein